MTLARWRNAGVAASGELGLIHGRRARILLGMPLGFGRWAAALAFKWESALPGAGLTHHPRSGAIPVSHKPGSSFAYGANDMEKTVGLSRRHVVFNQANLWSSQDLRYHWRFILFFVGAIFEDAGRRASGLDVKVRPMQALAQQLASGAWSRFWRSPESGEHDPDDDGDWSESARAARLLDSLGIVREMLAAGC